VKIARIRMLARVLPLALGLLATLPLSAAPAAPEPEGKRVVVTYFFLPG
jgi:hypothetical protein